MLARLVKFALGLAVGFLLGLALRSTRSSGAADEA